MAAISNKESALIEIKHLMYRLLYYQKQNAYYTWRKQYLQPNATLSVIKMIWSVHSCKEGC